MASRRAADELIASGAVRVNGRVPPPDGLIVDPERDRVTVSGRPVKPVTTHRYLMLNKPLGVITTAKDESGRTSVLDVVGDEGLNGHRLFPVGRLDADSTGLILLTDDGDLAHKLTHPSFEVPKTYRVKVRELPVSEGSLRRMREGLNLEDGRTAPAQVRQAKPGILEITIHEGRKHQVKRMCEAIGHPVVTLTRIAIGPLRLGDLAVGGVRRLSAAEVQRLRDAAGPD